MNEVKLKLYMADPALHKAALAGYEGGYSLGIGKDSTSGSAVLILNVTELRTAFPSHVVVDGELVQLIAQAGFRQPRSF